MNIMHFQINNIITMNSYPFINQKIKNKSNSNITLHKRNSKNEIT